MLQKKLEKLILSPSFFLGTTAVLCLPFLASLVFFGKAHQKLCTLQKEVITLTKISLEKQVHQKQEEVLLSQITKASPTYIQDFLASPTLLRSTHQKKQFYELQTKKAPSSSREALDTLIFTEGKSDLFPNFRETFFEQKESVLVDVEDLRTFLYHMEGVSPASCPAIPHRPQILIQSFHLEKIKDHQVQEELYKIHTRFLLRRGVP
ncbi:MAG: hypothetical protein FJZ58_06090 [Chlamydiae bacterium]|nr:hypothetical protein [Chlamydiota bacterium]